MSPEKALEIEKSKIKSAITTDFILSVEIVIIALGTVLNAPIKVQILTVSVVAIIVTIGVYGIVALIVRMDDAGYKIMSQAKSDKSILKKIGQFLVNALPWVIKCLGVIGTIALILVAGGIFDHNIEFLHHWLPNVPTMLKQFLYGIVTGVLMLPIFTAFKKLMKAVVPQKKSVS